MALFAGIELCAGVGMLGEGVRAAFGFLGHEYRTVCYVEREAAASGQLVTLMEAGIIDPAPIWSDMLTFDGAAWRGKVDCIIAGFPCQDLSIAGRRAGLDGKRSGLFFRVCDIADDCDARFLVLENVSAIASATASVVDETEGELEERAASRVMGELADRGWDAEWITLSASEVGASHRRARWFCFAWRELGHAGHDAGRSEQWQQSQVSGGRLGKPGQVHDVADPERAKRRQERASGDCGHQGYDRERQKDGWLGVAKQTLADASSERRQQIAGSVPTNESGEAGKDGRSSRHDIEPPSSGSDMGHARLQHQHPEQRADGAEYQGAGEPVDDPTSARRNGARKRTAADIEGWQCLPCSGRQDMANTISPRLQERTGGGSNHESLQPTERSDPISVCDALGIFAPGPDSTDWPGILDRFPHLAPATEPGLRGLVDGNPLVVDESRSHQLRAIGNGVVPLQASVAFVTLMRRASQSTYPHKL